MKRLLPVFLLFGCGWPARPQAASPAPPAAARKLDAMHDLSGALETLARRVNRCVVQIVTTGYTIGGDDGDSQSTSFLERQQSTGSGVLLSSDGYIVTNSHVVKGARRIRVLLPPSREQVAGRRSVLKPSGSSLAARLVGIDRDTDLAVLKIDGAGLPHLALGDSETLRQGQLVLAFGSPMGLQNSVSLGVVSSIARQLQPDDPMIYIQTDAPINPGNSGGPLVDVDGRVMGLNTFIMTQSGGSEGLGFAIPSNIVRNIYRQIRKDGHVHRGEIGITAQTITPALAAGLQLSRDWGVLVGDVDPDGPAAAARVQVGDIVVSVDGKIMENARQLQVDLYRLSVGELVKLEVLRGSTQLDMNVKVVEQDDDPLRFADLVDPEKNLVPGLGILGVEISPQVAQMLPDLRKPYGVVVAVRSANAPYLGDALQPGDVIHAVNTVPVTTIISLREALASIKPGDPLVLQIERQGALMFLPLELE